MPLKKYDGFAFEAGMNNNRKEMNEIIRNGGDFRHVANQLPGVFANYLLSQNPNLLQTVLSDLDNMLDVERQGLVDDKFSEANLGAQEALLRDAGEQLSDNPAERMKEVRDSLFDTPQAQSQYIAEKLFEKDPVFRALTWNGDPAELQKIAQKPKAGLASIVKQTRMCNALAKMDPEQSKTFDSAVEASYNAMLATGTGKNRLGMPRKSNSEAYATMMDSLKKIFAVQENEKRTPEQKAQDIAEAIASTKAYLSDKKMPSATRTGTIRFQQAMGFLGAVMPEDEFKKYCRDINRTRGVENEARHKDYVRYNAFTPINAWKVEPGKELKSAKSIGEYYRQEARRRDVQNPNAPDAMKEQRKVDRQAYMDYLEESNPTRYNELQAQKTSIEELKTANPNESKKQKKAYNNKLDALAAAWRRRQNETDMDVFRRVQEAMKLDDVEVGKKEPKNILRKSELNPGRRNAVRPKQNRRNAVRPKQNRRNSVVESNNEGPKLEEVEPQRKRSQSVSIETKL